MKKIRVFKYTIAMCSFVLMAPAIEAKEKSCFPDNNLRFPANMKSVGMTKDETLQAIEQFKNALNPYLNSIFGKQIKVHLQWEEERVNAVATLDEKNDPVINVFGGLVRYSMMDRDTFLAVLCHELGHPFGGAPKAPRGRSSKLSWSSAEGQADYFAAMKCLPLLWDGMTKLVPEQKDLRFPKNLDDCQDYGSCQWSLKAARGFAQFHASLVPGRALPDPKKRDPVVVGATNYGHPTPQCRLDTMVAGIFCPQGPDTGKFDDSDPEIGSCSEIGPHPEGARPRCWFAR